MLAATDCVDARGCKRKHPKLIVPSHAGNSACKVFAALTTHPAIRVKHAPAARATGSDGSSLITCVCCRPRYKSCGSGAGEGPRFSCDKQKLRSKQNLQGNDNEIVQ